MATPASIRRRVALTGARTFLGDRLIRALEDDPSCEHVVVMDVRPPTSGRLKTRFHRTDLTDPSSDEHMARVLRDEGIDTLVHTAFLAYPSHSRSWAHELEAIGSLYVMNAAADSGVKKVVLTSSTAVYGASPKNPAFLSEDAPLRGAKDSRWVTDRVAVEKDLARLGKDCPRLVTTSLRFGMTVGPTIRNFYTKLLTPQLVPTVMGYDPLMQYLHEDDAVAALLLAVREDHRGAHNIVGEGTLYYSDVIRLGGKVGVPVPHLMGYPLADALFNVQLSVVPGSFLDYFRFAWVADGKKAQERMGFRPQYTSRGALLSFFDTLSRGERPLHPEARPDARR
ncbi:MAG TPA: NAD-dependent epimerase/dehydratase family protein [Myxococcota bacterium]|nr:NAD-dependent epimerase/dehydratase family protein [Myxococcota bacterium]